MKLTLIICSTVPIIIFYDSGPLRINRFVLCWAHFVGDTGGMGYWMFFWRVYSFLPQEANINMPEEKNINMEMTKRRLVKEVRPTKINGHKCCPLVLTSRRKVVAYLKYSSLVIKFTGTIQGYDGCARSK